MGNEVYLSTLLITYPLPFIIRPSYNLLTVNQILQDCSKDREKF